MVSFFQNVERVVELIIKLNIKVCCLETAAANLHIAIYGGLSAHISRAESCAGPLLGWRLLA